MRPEYGLGRTYVTGVDTWVSVTEVSQLCLCQVTFTDCIVRCLSKQDNCMYLGNGYVCGHVSCIIHGSREFTITVVILVPNYAS
jgi:hypothetical protein